MPVINCRHFNGYKPCGFSSESGSTANLRCEESCLKKDLIEASVLIVHLGAIGAVLRSTSLLKAIARKHPRAHITWVTEAPCHKLLAKHPGIDQVLTLAEEDLLKLGTRQFDFAYVIDKSQKAIGVLGRTLVKQVRGFIAHPLTGAILPATPAATELWELGLNNQKKFFENQKPETQLMIEALELGEFKRDEYWLPLDAREQNAAETRKTLWLAQRNKKYILGINTGCSEVITAKKLTVKFHREIIEAVQQKFPELEIVLLGGPEDSLRNKQIAEGYSITKSDTDLGLRDGLVSVAACDFVLTGDSLGMHMGISQKKQVIAWFGPTCSQEIDLYERGIRLQTQSACAPCWKRSCDKNIMCYDQVSLKDILNAIELTTKSSYTNRVSGRPAPEYSFVEESTSAVAEP